MKRFACYALLATLFMPYLSSASIPAQTIDVEGIVKRADFDSHQRAEQVARMGEALLLPSSIDDAVEIFRTAIKLDPQNARAGFYLALLKPAVTLKGFYSRIEPAVLATNEAALIEHHRKEKENTLNYFRDGTPDLKTDADIQGLQKQLNEALDEAHRYLVQHAPLGLTLNSTIEEDNKDRVGWTTADRACKVERLGAGHFHIPACPHLTVKRYELDYADIVALRGIVTGQMLFGYLMTAYDLSGTLKLFGMQATAQKNADDAAMNVGDPTPGAGPVFISAEDMVRTLVGAGAGALKADHELKRIHDLGVDLLTGTKWLVKMHHSVCPKRYSRPRRPGHLFEEGVCIYDEDEKPDRIHRILRQASTTLAGGIIELSNGHGHTSSVQLSRIYTAPIPSLVPFAPKTFDTFGNATTLPDNGLNGIFVKDDAHKFYGIQP